MSTITIFLSILMLTLQDFNASKIENWREDNLKKNQSFHFYGRVLDQFGNSVIDAKVPIEISRFQLKPNYGLELAVDSVTLITDQNGNFEISNVGCSFAIRVIEKEGYEYRPDKKTNSIYDFERKCEMPTISNRAIFHMRKRNEPVDLCLANDEYSLDRGQSKTVRWDLVGMWRTERGVVLESVTSAEFRRGKTQRTRPVDLILEAKPVEPNVYSVSLTCPDANGGVMLTSDMLYDAPEAGYVQQVCLTVAKSMRIVTKYAYVKARSGGLYSQIELVMYNNSDGGITIRTERVTNPDGGRNLDYDPQWQFIENNWRDTVGIARRKAENTARMEQKPFDEEKFWSGIKDKKAAFKNEQYDMLKKKK